MSPEMRVERRQSRRATVGGLVEGRLSLRGRVRFLDISVTGALLAGEVTLPVGVTGEIRSAIGGGPLRADIQVRRTAESGPRGACFGASFTAMDERSQRSLEQFLQRASQ